MVMTRRSPLEPSLSPWFYGVVVLCLTVVSPGPAPVEGYPTGAPMSACESMLPEHDSLPQDGTDGLNIAITTNVTYYDPTKGISVFVSLTAETTDDVFKGFFIQARNVGGTTPLGRFYSNWMTPDGQRIVACSQRRTAVTHSDDRDKMIVTMPWYYKGTISDIVFVATIVKSEDTFWVNVTSEVLFPTTTTTPSGKGNQNATQTTTKQTTQEEVTESQTTLSTDATMSTHNQRTTISRFTTDGRTTSNSFQTTEIKQTRNNTSGAYTTSDFTTHETTQYITTDEAKSSTEIPATTDVMVTVSTTNRSDVTTSNTTFATSAFTTSDMSTTTSSVVFTSSSNVSETSDSYMTTPPTTLGATSPTANNTTPSFSGNNVTTTTPLSTVGNLTTLFPSDNASTTPFMRTQNVTTLMSTASLTSEPNMTTILPTPVVTPSATLQTTLGTPPPNTSFASTTESQTPLNQTEAMVTTTYTGTDNSTLNTTQTETVTTDIMTTTVASNDTTTLSYSVNVTDTYETTNVTTSPTPAITTTAQSTVSNVTLQTTSELANVTNGTVTTNVTTQVPIVTTTNASSLPPSTSQTSTGPVNVTMSWMTTKVTSTPVPVISTSAHPAVSNATVRSTRAPKTPSPSTGSSTLPMTTIITRIVSSMSATTATTGSSPRPMTTNITRIVSPTDSSETTRSEGPLTFSRPIATEQPITQAADEVFVRFRIVNEEYTSDLTRPSSSKYQGLEAQVVTVMEDVYVNEPSLENITVLKFSPGSVIPDVKLTFSSSLNESDKVAVVQVLYDEAEDGQLGSFSVDKVSSLDENGLYQEVDECYLNPCPPNVNCSSDRCSYPCSDNPGYCRNGGQCSDLTSGDQSRTFANCTCDENHEGLRCDDVIKKPSEPTDNNRELLIIVLAAVCGVLFVLFAALLIAVIIWCRRFGSTKRTIEEDPVEVAKMQFRAEMRRRYGRSNSEESPGNGSLTSVNQYATTSFSQNPEAILPRNFVAIGDVETSSGSLFYITDSDSESDHFRPKIFDDGVTFPNFSQMMGSVPDLLGPVADYELDVMRPPSAAGTGRQPNNPLRQRSVSFSDIQQVITDDDHIGFENFTFGNQADAKADNSNFQVRWDFQIGGSESPPVGEKSDSDDANGGKEVEDEGGGSRETTA